MKYNFHRVVALITGAIFVGIGGVFALISLASEALLGLAFGSLFIAIGLYTTWQRLRQLHLFQTRTYDWYRTQFPKHVHGMRIACHGCGNTRIHVRGLMNRTFHREHLCSQCGKTLYYSPEQS